MWTMLPADPRSGVFFLFEGYEIGVFLLIGIFFSLSSQACGIHVIERFKKTEENTHE